jgi:hypothetical protein
LTSLAAFKITEELLKLTETTRAQKKKQQLFSLQRDFISHAYILIHDKMINEHDFYEDDDSDEEVWYVT